MVSAPERPRVTVGICTRQRNALLRLLLESIWKQPHPPGYDFEVIIVDNNDVPSVTPDVVSFPPKFKLMLVHEPKPGLANARNRALDEASSAKADWFIGVDDDELVAENWLAQYIVAFETLQADIIVAARHLIYADATSPFVERMQQDQHPAGEVSQILSSANYALNQRVFDPASGLGLRFDPALNESGGEDYEFMLRAKYRHGLKPIRWPFAIATENYDGIRATFRYQFRRRYLDQLTRYRIFDLHRRNGLRGTRTGNFLRVLRLTNEHVILGFAHITYGLFLGLTGRKAARQTIGAGLLRWARALAVLPYFLGKSAVHYGSSANADRSARI